MSRGAASTTSSTKSAPFALLPAAAHVRHGAVDRELILVAGAADVAQLGTGDDARGAMPRACANCTLPPLPRDGTR